MDPDAPSTEQPRALTVWQVDPHPLGWVVTQRGYDGYSSRHADQEAAVREAHLLAQRHGPSEVVLTSENGKLVWTFEYPERVGPSTNGHEEENRLLPGAGRVETAAT